MIYRPFRWARSESGKKGRGNADLLTACNWLEQTTELQPRDVLPDLARGLPKKWTRPELPDSPEVLLGIPGDQDTGSAS